MSQLPLFTPPAHRSGRLLKMADVKLQTSLHPATIYRGIQAGTFPKQVRIGLGRVGWWESDIEAWKAACSADLSD